MQLALRQEFLEIGTGRYSFYPTFFQNLTQEPQLFNPMLTTQKVQIDYYFEFPTTPIVHDNLPLAIAIRHRHLPR